MTDRRRQAALVAYRALSDVAGKGAFFLVTIVAARRLSQQAFGVFSLGTTIGWIAAVATDFGIQMHLARAVAQQPGDAVRLLRSWLRVRLGTAALSLVTVATGLAFAGAAPALSRAILLLTAAYVVNGLIEFLHYFYRATARTDIESTLTLWQRSSMLVLAVAVLWWMPDLTALAVAMTVPAIVTFWYSARLAKRLARNMGSIGAYGSYGSMGSTRSMGSAELRDSLGSIIPIGAGIVLSALYFRVDIFLVQAWQGTTAVALYNAVFRLVDALRLFPAAVLAVALPAICRATSRHVLVRLSSALTGAALLVSLVLWTAAGVLIPTLYGARYADAVPAFRVLLLAFPFMSLNYVLTYQLIGWHRHRAYAVMCAVALVFNVVANRFLIPSLGILGAAWSTVGTELVITVGCSLALARLTNRPVVANLSNLSSVTLS